MAGLGMGFESRTSHEAAHDRDARIRRALEEVIRRRERGEVIGETTLRQEHPDLMPELLERVAVLPGIEQACHRAMRLESDTWDRRPATKPPHWARDTLAGYELRGQIQRGGQAVLYRARQSATGREVAIKVMQEGPLIGPRDCARFDREVRVLGHLRHPNIVTIHDSGSVDGCRFFVMDYIDGDTLEEHLAKQRMSVDAILRLFVKIAQPVHAAHLRGIVHRDLKPTNILIDHQGEPHILDFGLAKLATEEIDEATEWRQMTLTGQFVGTLPWASPEQADGPVGCVDLRTDIYSLGMIVYYMLTGDFPYPVVGKMPDIVRHILETAPARLAGRVPAIDEDVETIVLKCLAKEPERRYQSVAAIIEDVERYLRHQPIQARSPSTAYQLRKLVRRHKLPFALLGAVVLIAMGAAVSLGILYRQAAAERNRALDAEALADNRRTEAEVSAETARLTREFLISDVIGVDLWAVGGRNSTVGEALDHAARRLREAPPLDGRTRAALNHTIGSAYLARGDDQAAYPHLMEAIDAYSRFSPPRETFFGAKAALAEALSRKGETQRGAELAAATSQEAQNALGAEHPMTLTMLKVHADLRWRHHQDDESAMLVEAVALRCAAALGDEHLTTLGAHFVLAALVRPWQGRAAEGAATLRSLLTTYRRIRGEDSLEALATELHLGPMLRDQGYLAEAEPLLVKTRDRFARVFGEESGEAIAATIHLGILRRTQNRHQEAAELLEGAAAAAQRGFGVDHPHYQSSIQYLASVYSRQGRLCKAGPMMEQLLAHRRRTRGLDDVGTCTSEVELAGTYYTVGRFAEAELLARHATGQLESQYDDGGNGAVWPRLWLARILVAMGRNDEAVDLARAVLAARRKQADRPDATIQDILYFAREMLTIDPPELRDAQLALDYLEGVQSPQLADGTRVDHYIAMASAELGDHDLAVTLMEQILQATPREYSQIRNEREDMLVKWYGALSAPQSGLEVLRATLAGRAELLSPYHPDVLNARLRLTEALIDAQQFQEAAVTIGNCADFEDQLDNCLVWREAKCRVLHIIALTGLGQLDSAADRLLTARNDLIADPWAPEVEREKADSWIARLTNLLE